MQFSDIIARKRDGHPLSESEISHFVQAYSRGELPDYQAAAFLMAVFVRGMTSAETTALTLAMAASGEQLDWSDLLPYAVDKHSSGGLGDTTTLVVLPLVAACGVPVVKMSGRGLGHSGGTLDKIEAIAGFRHQLSVAEMRAQVEKVGLALAGQSADLAPADGKFYALRDVTATVNSIPLIAASIMSKKLAGGAQGIVLDVKVGSGAFTAEYAEARQLAQEMVAVGRAAGRDMVALIADMNQPLGRAVGNALEVAEACRTLCHNPPTRLREHCLIVASTMLQLARAGTIAAARRAQSKPKRARRTGNAPGRWQRLREIAAVGGRPGRRPAPAGGHAPPAPGTPARGFPRPRQRLPERDRCARARARLYRAGRRAPAQRGRHRPRRRPGDARRAGRRAGKRRAPTDDLRQRRRPAGRRAPDLLAGGEGSASSNSHDSTGSPFTIGEARSEPPPLIHETITG